MVMKPSYSRGEIDIQEKKFLSKLQKKKTKKPKKQKQQQQKHKQTKKNNHHSSWSRRIFIGANKALINLK